MGSRTEVAVGVADHIHRQRADNILPRRLRLRHVVRRAVQALLLSTEGDVLDGAGEGELGEDLGEGHDTHRAAAIIHRPCRPIASRTIGQSLADGILMGGSSGPG